MSEKRGSRGAYSYAQRLLSRYHAWRTSAHGSERSDAEEGPTNTVRESGRAAEGSMDVHVRPEIRDMRELSGDDPRLTMPPEPEPDATSKLLLTVHSLAEKSRLVEDVLDATPDKPDISKELLQATASLLKQQRELIALLVELNIKQVEMAEDKERGKNSD